MCARDHVTTGPADVELSRWSLTGRRKRPTHRVTDSSVTDWNSRWLSPSSCLLLGSHGEVVWFRVVIACLLASRNWSKCPPEMEGINLSIRYAAKKTKDKLKGKFTPHIWGFQLQPPPVCPVFCLVYSMVPHQFLHCWGHNCSCSQWLWYNFVLIWKNVCPLSHDWLPACPGRAHHRHQHPVNNYLFLRVCNYLQRRRRTLGNPVSIIWRSRFFNCLRTGTQI